MSSTTKSTKEKLHLAPFRLSDVRIYEINIERCENEKGDDEIEFETELRSSDIDKEDNSFNLMLLLHTKIPEGKDSICNLDLSIEGRFEAIVDIDTIREEFINEFKSRTGLFLLWPYLRQYLHDITNRLHLGVPPLPLIDISIPPETEEA